jgi:NADH-quinone oxidoreductase subunit M
VQNDLKKLAAYSTLGQLSFIVLGIFTLTISGLDGGIYQILNESLAGAALFMLLGLLYERYDTNEIRLFGGLAQQLPWVVTMFAITTLSIIGLPMLNSFVGEFLVLSGSMQSPFAHHHFWTGLAATGVILSAAYMLSMIQRVFYCDLGPKPASVAARDLDAREHLTLWPLLALFLIMGVASPYWMRAIDGFGVNMADHPKTAQSTAATTAEITSGGAR